MASIFRLVGNDTILINGRTLADFGHGEIGKITFETAVVTVKTGKNGSAIFASNESGNQATVEIRVLRGSSDDKALNTINLQYKTDPVSFTLINGVITKKLGDGAGAITSDTFTLTGGVITKNVEVLSNIEGDVEQAISVYTMQFATAARTIV